MLIKHSVRWSLSSPRDGSPMASDHGDFYVEQACCTSCGVPQAIALELVGWRNQNQQLNCYWIKQPETADELDRAIKILHTQELGCHRYSGSDPAILKRCPPEDCHDAHPATALTQRFTFGASDIPVKFSLSALELGDGLLSRLWRKVARSKSSKQPEARFPWLSA